MPPLSGITVVSIEQAVSAPFATRQLADLGARVVKVERPDTGDFARSYDGTVRGMSAYFVWINRSKESLTLDLKHPMAPEVMERLVDRADVLVQNLAPGAADRLGLSFEKLRQDHPRLIVCDISGYGDEGPCRNKKAYDLLIQSEAGLLSVTGTTESPSKAGISIADISAGMYAFSGILAALIQRGRTGKGTRVEVSMFEALAEWMGHPLYYRGFGGGALGRTGARHATIAPYGPFAAGDGGTVMVGLQNEREWKDFCDKVIGRPELASDPRFATNSRRVENSEALTGMILDAFAPLSREQVIERLDGARIANARMNEIGEVWNHPQLAARRRWREVDTPAGRIPALLPPATFSDFEACMGPVPALGEHSRAILSELGYSADEIARMRDSAAV